MSLSSDVLPRIREWPRMSTTLNTYLEPVLVHYIGDLSDGLDEGGVETQQRFLMQSNGVMPFKAAVAGAKTVHTLSCPAAGAGRRLFSGRGCEKGSCNTRYGWHLLRHCLYPGRHTIGSDRGRGRPATTGRPSTGSHDHLSRRWIHCLGRRRRIAGGRSASAGADPGPVCYGKGGENPTVTDADIACGFLNPDYFWAARNLLMSMHL